MKREEDLDEICDGRRYGLNDMVRTDCKQCVNCHKCCTDMGDTVILDPYDINRLLAGCNTSFEGLLNNYVGLGVYDGIILPHLAMIPSKAGSDSESQCAFLGMEGDMNGRCTIHEYRPGFCRIFPLGRLYEEGSFSYILQKHQCPFPDKGKIKVSRWIAAPDLKKYEMFIRDWHYFVLKVQNKASQADEQQAKQLSMLILQLFFMKSMDLDQFYEQFYSRLKAAEDAIFSE